MPITKKKETAKVPPKREPITRGRELEWDLTDVDSSSMLAELIRRGYRPLEIPQPKTKPRRSS